MNFGREEAIERSKHSYYSPVLQKQEQGQIIWIVASCVLAPKKKYLHLVVRTVAKNRYRSSLSVISSLEENIAVHHGEQNVQNVK